MVLTRALEKASTGQFLTIYVFGVFGDLLVGSFFGEFFRGGHVL